MSAESKHVWMTTGRGNAHLFRVLEVPAADAVVAGPLRSVCGKMMADLKPITNGSPCVACVKQQAVIDKYWAAMAPSGAATGGEK